MLRPTMTGAHPLGTLTINVLGCLGIGALLGFSQNHPSLSETTRLFVVVGLLGSFTTFSTFGHEIVTLFEQNQIGRGVLYVGLNLSLGLSAVWVGATWVQGSN